MKVYNFLFSQWEAVTRGWYLRYTRCSPVPICVTVQLWILLWSHLFLSVTSRERWQCDPGKTNGADKQSLCVTPHFHCTKETLTFVIAAATGPYFPRCHDEKILFFFFLVQKPRYTKDAPQVFVSLVPPF